MKKLIKEDTIGRVVEFNTHFDRYKPTKATNWKGNLGMDQAGGVVYDLGTHLLDQVYVLFGMPKTVTGFFETQRNDGDAEPDSITVVLAYGEIGRASCSSPV